MEDIEDDHSQKHQCGVEDIQVHLGLQKRPIVALNILGDTEDGSDHNERAGDIEDQEVPLPRDWDTYGLDRWVFGDPHVEDTCDNYEEAEEDHLDT